jgi:hypothetical protein
MEEIRDYKGRLACKGDATTGNIESIYKGHRTKTCLSVGDSFVVERDGIITEVTRISTDAFQVESHTDIECY